MKKYNLFINNKWVKPDSGEYFDSIDPYTQEAWCQIARGNKNDATKAIDAAYSTFHSKEWSNMTGFQRSKLLLKLADLIEENIDLLATTESKDNGKLITEMKAQVKSLVNNYKYFSGLASNIKGEVLPSDGSQNLVITKKEPIGVILAISPWNSPLLTTTVKIAPALAAGNTIVIKPSEEASASCLEFANLFKLAGFPDGVINFVTGFGNEIGESLASNPKISLVAFTGGPVGGQKVYTSASKNIKPVVLELGGKSPNIIFDDANIDNAVNGAVSGIFAASGQTCIAGSRLFVHEEVHDEVVEKIKNIASRIKQGNPMDETTEMGPMANKAQYNKVLEYFNIVKEDGATCILGGKASDKGGLFIDPTIYINVKNDMRIAQEEVFGPVLSVIKFSGEEEVVKLANDITYGLASGIWTTSMQRAIRVSNQIQAGTVWINTYRAVSTLAPYGGYKDSGIGRENGEESLNEYLQTKTIWLSTAEEIPNSFIMKV